MSEFNLHEWYVAMARRPNASIHDETALANYEADTGLSSPPIVRTRCAMPSFDRIPDGWIPSIPERKRS